MLSWASGVVFGLLLLANAISENEPNYEPDCEIDCEIGHDIKLPPDRL